MKNQEMIIYQSDSGAIQLRTDANVETLWATQKQIAGIFGVKTPAVNKHIKNILSAKELDNSTISILETVQQEGNRTVNRKVEHYNLDMLISIGYRVNSKMATKFRQWATQTLKQHITRGYTINQHLLDEKRVRAEQIITDIQQLAQGNTQIQLDEVLDLVKSFTHTWFSLQSYDSETLPDKGLTEITLDVQVKDLYAVLGKLKAELKAKGETSDLFAQEKNRGELAGILGNVMQSVFGEDAYPTIEEKAAHLLYFIIKDHPFNDGNKRCGAFGFIWLLRQAQFPIKKHIHPNMLTALTLLIAESDPKHKNQMIGLVLQLLREQN